MTKYSLRSASLLVAFASLCLFLFPPSAKASSVQIGTVQLTLTCSSLASCTGFGAFDILGSANTPGLSMNSYTFTFFDASNNLIGSGADFCGAFALSSGTGCGGNGGIISFTSSAAIAKVILSGTLNSTSIMYNGTPLTLASANFSTMIPLSDIGSNLLLGPQVPIDVTLASTATPEPSSLLLLGTGLLGLGAAVKRFALS